MFPSRPRPVCGESLSGYLMRLAAENHQSLLQVIKPLNIYYTARPNRSWLYAIDRIGLKVINAQLLSQWADISLKTIEDMTFMHVWEKFGIKVEDSDLANILISANHVTTQRHFCPTCLRETGVFYLTWQIREIPVCNIHNRHLIAECSYCHRIQPYVSPSLGHHFCAYCAADLALCTPGGALSPDMIDLHTSRLDEWEFLLSRNGHVVPPEIPGLTIAQSVVVALRYIARINNYPRVPLHHKHVQSAKEAFKLNGEMNAFPKLNRILDVCRKSGFSIQELHDIEIPHTFVQMVIESPKSAFVCQTPWCRSLGLKSKIIKGSNQQRVMHNGTYYNSHSLCLDCGIQYGVDSKDGTWKPVADMVSLILRVRDLLEQGLTRTEVAHEIRRHPDKVFQIAGYLAYYNILGPELTNEFTPEKREYEGHILAKFKEVAMSGGTFYLLSPEIRLDRLHAG